MRKKNTIQKVDKAIQRFVRAREKINFNSVASEAGVSKATLYNHMEIRKRIESLREQQSQVKREIDENNKDAIIEAKNQKSRRGK